MLLEGFQLDRYHLQEKIGKGGVGQVYRARDTHMSIGREVAVKVILLPENDIDIKSAMEFFLREVRAITQLNHPHILSLFDYGIDPRTRLAYMAMPICQDGSLASWRENHALSPEVVMHFLHQAADALQHAHDNKIIHKDVKPQNFLIQKNIDDPKLPDLVLTDFGIAKLHTSSFSLGNLPSGTPYYMAPEQWNRKPVYASDQYSLAIMAYQLLTGRVPFQGNNPEEIAERHHTVQPVPPSKLKSDLPVALDAIIFRALAKKPEERYSSITEFSQTLITVYEQAKEQKQLTEIEQKIVQGQERLYELQQKLLEVTKNSRLLQQRQGDLQQRQQEEQKVLLMHCSKRKTKKSNYLLI
jgi:eukaryotic-like serine/threonine-protein kinase